MVSGGVGGNGLIFGHYRPLLRFSRISGEPVRYCHCLAQQAQRRRGALLR
ncbi:TPA: hypothetical protein HH149_004880 [Escherichia coli]|nr:hypothetical protein [Escherichia coli]HAH4967532.1 hypothetical protein [Escherichia coli]HAH5574306.1 hypothetical protein [Escherichia coli]